MCKLRRFITVTQPTNLSLNVAKVKPRLEFSQGLNMPQTALFLIQTTTPRMRRIQIFEPQVLGNLLLDINDAFPPSTEGDLLQLDPPNNTFTDQYQSALRLASRNTALNGKK
jgi:hypothetical protein